MGRTIIIMESKKVCIWCNKSLPKRRRKYCSDECSHQYFVNVIAPLWWVHAVAMALKRADYKCEECGSMEKLEVHHIIPLEHYEDRFKSEKNNQDNLKVLCRPCHEIAHHGVKVLRTIPKEQLALF